jgi:hypothetical protein
MLDDWVFEMPRAYSRRTGINEKEATVATAIYSQSPTGVVSSSTRVITI